MQAPSGTDARRHATLHKIGYQELATIYGKEHFFLMEIVLVSLILSRNILICFLAALVHLPYNDIYVTLQLYYFQVWSSLQNN